MADKLVPGEKAPRTTTYEPRGPRGGRHDQGPDVDVDKGKTMPPTERPGQSFVPKKK